jgi:hypothetical protein
VKPRRRSSLSPAATALAVVGAPALADPGSDQATGRTSKHGVGGRPLTHMEKYDDALEAPVWRAGPGLGGRSRLPRAALGRGSTSAAKGNSVLYSIK